MLALLSLVVALLANQATAIRQGSSPQLAIDARGTIRMIFGHRDTIFAVTSRNRGETFGPATVVGVVSAMHLGNTRGPTIASSRTRSVVIAIDKAGDITMFQLDHATDRWTRLPGILNDAPGTAPEGLATVAANDADGFYAVWLDLREGRQNQVYFGAVPTAGTKRTPNRRLYASPDGHVCECCRPSIAIAGPVVAVMFRNWIAGARDMYLTVSTNGARQFGTAQKLGDDSWKLDACPMDGGGLAVDDTGAITSVWRREATLYYAHPGQREVRIGQGRLPAVSSGDEATYIAWQDEATIKVKALGGAAEAIVGEGRLPQVLALRGGGAVAAWEKGGIVYYRKL